MSGLAALGEQVEVDRVTIGIRCHHHQLQKAPQTDGQLPVKGVGVRQLLVRIKPQLHYVLSDQGDEPGLPVMRVGGQDGMGQRVDAGVGIGCRSGKGPGLQRLLRGAGRGKDGCTTCGQDHTTPYQLEKTSAFHWSLH